MQQIKIIILFFLILGCRKKDFIEHIFLPQNFEGPIIIRYNVSHSKNRIIKSGDNTYIYFITKNNRIFDVKDDAPPVGYYETNVYYYDQNKLQKINSDGNIDDLNNPFPVLTNGSNIPFDRKFVILKDSSTLKKSVIYNKILNENYQNAEKLESQKYRANHLY